jgi:hypothetical protein
MILTDLNVQISLDQVLHAQGIIPSTKKPVRQKLVENTIRAIKIGTPLLKPAVEFDRYTVCDINEKGIFLEGGGSLEGPVVASHLAGSSEIVLGVCTIGGEVDNLVSETFRSDPALALALEGFASAAVLVLGNAFCNRIEKQVHIAGLKISSPINPGDEGWPVEIAQPQIFALLNTQQVGVQLEESGLMRPLKSLSLVFGIGAHLRKHQTSCAMCNLRSTCMFQPASG